MRLIDLKFFLPLIFFAFASCGKSSSDASSDRNSPTNGTTLPPLSGSNVLSMTVNGSACGGDNSYPNKPCVSVTICTPNTSTCQTINDILVDTGSSGLRIFKSLLTSVTLTPQTSGSGTVAECIEFGSGADWGTVATAGVVLGSEPAVNVPIQLIDASFSDQNTYCSGADQSPTDAGFNGILGVGLFVQDCGTICAQEASNNTYFSCVGSTCTSIVEATGTQVQNPVALLPTDNNGVILELPSVPLGGADSASGYLVLGIGTQSNNQPTSGLKAFVADPTTGEFQTSFDGNSVTSFLDSGSNGLLFPSNSLSSLPDCGGQASGWYCPKSTVSLTATNTSADEKQSGDVGFQIGNFNSLITSPNHVFMEVGEDGPGMFDWGLPFYIGRNVYVGIENTSSSLSTGPYWAY